MTKHLVHRRVVLAALALLVTTCGNARLEPLEIFARSGPDGERTFEITIRRAIVPGSLRVRLNGVPLGPSGWTVEEGEGAVRVTGPLERQRLRAGENALDAQARTEDGTDLADSTTFVHAPAGTRSAGHRRLEGHVDWQGHPAMHLAWPFFRPGLTEDVDASLTWKHQFQQTVYAPQLRASGIRIFATAAMAAERAENEEQARELILDQIEYVERFVTANAEDFALARTPEEARWLLENTDRIVIVHSIEGGRKILSSARDARFWAEQGVALITLIHLLDDELGASALDQGALSAAINPRGYLRRLLHPKAHRGLTARGKEAIVELAREGILVDLTHMSPDSVEDALAVCRAHGIAPVVTHGTFSPVRRSERSFTPEQVLEVYRLGGAFSIPLNANSLDPDEPSVEVPGTVVPGTISSFRFHHETLQRWIVDHAALALEDPSIRTASDLTEDQRTRLSVGWASDWNGWTDHTRPYPAGSLPAGTGELEIDRVGLAHPGLLPQHWQRLRESGMDLDPLERSVEQFLRVWEQARLGSR